jgi:hypothetical protein
MLSLARNLSAEFGARVARGARSKQGRKPVGNLEFSVLIEVAIAIQRERH